MFGIIFHNFACRKCTVSVENPKSRKIICVDFVSVLTATIHVNVGQIKPVVAQPLCIDF